MVIKKVVSDNLTLILYFNKVGFKVSYTFSSIAKSQRFKF